MYKHNTQKAHKFTQGWIMDGDMAAKASGWIKQNIVDRVKDA